MSLLIDFGFIAIFAYSVWRGFRRGAIMGICSVIAIILSIIVANVVTDVYSAEFTGLLEPFAGGMMDSAIDKVRGPETEDLVVVLTEAEKNDVTSVAHAALRQVGICETVSTQIATEVGEQMATFGNEMSNAVTDRLCERAMHAVVFVVIFSIAVVIFVVIGNIFNLRLTVPEFEKINRYAGIGIGVIIGLAAMLAVALAFRYLGLIVSHKVIEKTVLFEYFINHNLLANIIGV